MARGRIVAYTGPTLPPEEVLAAVPEAEPRPPVARGDLYAEEWDPRDTAVIIDGYYRDRLSVGHKEILWLLSQGVEVVGAASMGALRAAELEPFGMRGIGTVYRMYATREVDGDDEVAVLHGPASIGYNTVTAALVNIRYGCGMAAESNLIPAETGAQIVAAAKSLPFTHRTWDELAQALAPELRDPLHTLQQMIDSGEWDVKRLDALSALRSVGDPHGAVRTASLADEPALTAVAPSELLRWRSMREYAPGRRMSDLDVLNVARLFDDGYPDLHEQVLTELLADTARSHELDLDTYLSARLGTDGRSPLPEPLARWLTKIELNDAAAPERVRLVAVRVWPVWQSLDWRSAVLGRMRTSERWADWSGMVVHAGEVSEQTRYKIPVPPPLMCGRLFLRHWQRPGTSPDVEMARRGFVSLEELGRAVSPFFAYDVKRKREG